MSTLDTAINLCSVFKLIGSFFGNTDEYSGYAKNIGLVGWCGWLIDIISLFFQVTIKIFMRPNGFKIDQSDCVIACVTQKIELA